MKRIAVNAIVLCALTLNVSAQTDDKTLSNYDKFRKEMLADYEGFHRGILDDYDKFLDEVWKEYEHFLGEKRDQRPKPQAQPQKQPSEKPTDPVRQTPDVPQPVPTPSTPPTTPPTPTPIPPAIEYQRFSFYGVSVQVPKVDYSPLTSLSIYNFGEGWRTLKQLEVEKQVLPALQQTSTACNLNDWFFFELCQTYADAMLTNGTPASRLLLTHYLMTHQGYDVRLGRTTEVPFLLLPMNQMVYARSYLNINSGRYHIFTDRLSGQTIVGKQSYYSCNIPTDVDAGRKLDLIVRPLNMPERKHAFSISYSGLTLKGEVNATLMDMVRHYPQMPVPDYARSTLSPSLRRSIVSQMKTQLSGSQGLTAINRLLRFVQKGFDYATDDDFHGYEKPYFFEETLYYPKCDCEDRSVFFAYLVKEVLDVNNCLIHYPGHECTAIIRSDLSGDGFLLNNTSYFITDPTYMGADAGMCMPQFKNETPRVEFWY